MATPRVSTELPEGQERHHRTLLAIATNDLIKVRPPNDRTEAEVAASVTPTNYAYPPGDVRRYGADPAGVVDSASAFNQAILANSYIYIPPGTYLIASKITIVGNKVITGPNSGTNSNQTASIIDAIPAGASIRSSTATAGTETTITLDAGASAVDDFYNYNLINITGGTGSGQAFVIIDYVGATKVATVDRVFTTFCDATSTFTISVATHLFEDVAGNFGGVYIGNFAVSGGNSTSSYCVFSTRPQSVIEHIHMEGASGYAKNGIAVVDGSASGDGSWGSYVGNCKYVAPNSATNYRGYVAAVDGGNLDLEFCLATRGSVGLEIIKGETIRAHKCNFNLQDSSHSSESATLGQCAVRISGTQAKKSISLDACYLEGSNTLAWIEDVEAMRIVSTFCDDLGAGNTGNIKIRGATSRNVIIESTHIRARLNGAKNIVNAGSNTILIGNVLICDGDATTIPLDNSGSQLVAINNRITGNVAGTAIKTTTAMVDIGNVLVSGTYSDSNGVAQYTFPTTGTWTPVLAGNTTAGTNTYSIQQGNWTSIGRMVLVDFVITMTAKDAAMAGAIKITGLPFTAKNLSNSAVGCALSQYDNVDLSAGKSQLTAQISANTATFFLIENGDNVAAANVVAGGITATTSLRGTAIYTF